MQRRLDPGDASVALTFDDGPDPRSTPQVLDELARLGVVATFFVVGHRAQAWPELVGRMLREGHAVGSHSHSHPEAWRTAYPRVVRDYRRGRQALDRVAGRRIRLFRPPNGYLDGQGVLAVMALRLRPWLWTIDPGDWRPGATSADILAGVEALAAGDVVLLHDALDGPDAGHGADRSATTSALDGIAELAAERGLRFRTLV